MQTGFDFVYLYRWRIYFQLEGQEGLSEEVTFKMKLKEKEKPSWKDLEKDHCRKQNPQVEEAWIVLGRRKASVARLQ